MENELIDLIIDDVAKLLDNLFRGDRRIGNDTEFSKKVVLVDENEMTAVMMETARKGLWQASAQQLSDIAKLHTDLVNKYKPSCSGFVCDNAKLQQFIAKNVDSKAAADYSQNIRNIRETSATADKQGMVMKKDQLSQEASQKRHFVSGILVAAGVAVALALLVAIVRKRRKNME